MEISQPDNLRYTDSDRPVGTIEADEFGFVAIAKNLAPALTQAMGQDGLVIGFEGVWGSGKTSLVNYVLQEIERTEGASVEIILLAPWLSGDDESLVGTLLERIAETVEKRDHPHGLERVRRWMRGKSKGPLPSMLRKYGAKTGRALTPMFKIGGLILPGMSAAGDIAELSSDALDALGKSPTNAQLKEAISERLKGADCRFLVILDDLDRLEPAQAIEVIRLVRSVADFPKILYLMCYDRKVLAHALEKGIGVENGDLFLRKIVQQTFSIPLPEPFDLRVNFTHHAVQHFEQVQGRAATQQEKSEIQAAVHEWGGQLRTPRDVKLTLNGLRFHYMPVKEDVYFPDVCRIQLMRVVEPTIYRWLEEYMGEYSVIATGDGRVNQEERTRMGKRLRKMFSEDPDSVRSMWTMRELVPGLGAFNQEKASDLVYRDVTYRELRKRSDAKRFGSPFHYRYYFALAPARTVLPQEDYGEVLEAASVGSGTVTQALEELYRRPRQVGGNWLAQFFTRIAGFSGDGCSSEQVQNIMLGIADLMDSILREEKDNYSRQHGLARHAEEAMAALFHYLATKGKERAQDAILHVLERSESMTWVAGYLMRSELHRHGLTDGQRAERPERWLLADEYLERGMEVVRNRVAEWAQDGHLLLSPDLASILYGWRDLGAIEDARAWVQAYVANDEGFVDFLLRMRGWAMSNRVYFPLHKKAVGVFLDGEDIDARLGRIARDHVDDTLRQQAQVAIDAIELAKDS